MCERGYRHPGAYFQQKCSSRTNLKFRGATDLGLFLAASKRPWESGMKAGGRTAPHRQHSAGAAPGNGGLPVSRGSSPVQPVGSQAVSADSLGEKELGDFGGES